MTDLILPSLSQAPTADRHKALRAAANKLEAAFLAEMLKSAGLGAPRSEFGGGAGEEQFASYLRQAQAEAIVEGGGIGLAENLFQALLRREQDDR